MPDFFSQTIWLIPCYALIGAGLALPWSPGFIRRTGPRPAGYINALMTFMAFVHSLIALVQSWKQPPYGLSFEWLNAPGLTISLDLEISSVALGACVLITGLNLVAQIYAIAYLEMDWGWARLYSLLGLFEAGMCLLVLCSSLFFSYVILEILTLGTYLIVGIWYNQSLVVTGARDAFLTKRVGDLILLMAVVALLPLSGTWNFRELALWAQTVNLDPTLATLLALALIAGPVAKCAQFPLHLWLDEAMEGPYPATILRNTVVVSTGAWVLIKVQPILALSPLGSSVVFAIGAATAVGTSLISVAQIDVKRVLSYLTSAYLGIIFIAVGVGATQAALVLLLTYALAMSLLIMSTGGIVLNNISQDLTQYGGLWSRRPISGLCLMVGGVSLIALPPFAGFWSLVPIAEALWDSHPSLFVVVLAVNAIVAFSVTRLFGRMFAGAVTDFTRRSPEGLWLLVLPMTVVAGVTLHLPLLFVQWQLLPDWATVNPVLAVLLTGSSLGGIGLGAMVYLNPNWPKPVKLSSQALQDFFAYDFYTPQLYKGTIIFVVDRISKAVYWLDRYIIDGAVNLVGLATVFSGETLKYNTSGRSQFYAFSIILSVAVFIVLTIFPYFSSL
ncbi:NAD(P)H-quinone oxidoreductase subunit F [Spirulina subsalsa FACHB-351]|uniref:NAD(P)H-quinone oxidoreductase subunit F n=1 Tax=Spirulina subsalsa FACHB-351 TaxID=234711 RepID=A0ABT3L113_9CYAN|nr:NAD(P)H-quinone oxidoreductase subunit F [Spirulina subsalsa]MCW6035194.1 NAD(P)H-quinone oxidoreductase subunit F [Spirulina subsalsa FACHB-351]